ncbi:Transcription initiation factor TFIID subunit 7-like protein [Myotis davidii]|uniref:Transcription initiation factor TFIID subunit 7-like protein n=1 Tax=Myotis davidii TaxID=225400 RepID=L5LUR2_MYODS|nr:Transcription initiation factor TFIID subunit 7-like protein [Myotis davidii]
MEYPEGQFSQLSERNSKLKTLISETKSFQEPKIVVDSGTKTASDYRTQIAGEQGTSTLVDHGAQGDAQAAARPPLENLTGRQADGRHAAVEVKDVSLTAKVVDLPCVIGSLKTLDNKMFYKTADISQGTDSPDSEKEVKRLLYSDAEAVSVRWEVIAEGETKEIESKGSVPSFEMSPGTSGYKRGDSSPVVEIRKHIHYMEKKIQEIQCRAQRQKNLIKKVENLTLKRGRERDRELETSMREKHRSAASCTSPTRDVPTTQVHALDRNRTWDP